MKRHSPRTFKQPPFQRNRCQKKPLCGLRPHLEQLEDRRLLAAQDLSSLPAAFTKFGFDVVFAAQGEDGHELCKWDGVAASQIANSNPTNNSVPIDHTESESNRYFVASDGVAEAALWNHDRATGIVVKDFSNLFRQESRKKSHCRLWKPTEPLRATGRGEPIGVNKTSHKHSSLWQVAFYLFCRPKSIRLAVLLKVRSSLLGRVVT